MFHLILVAWNHLQSIDNLETAFFDNLDNYALQTIVLLPHQRSSYLVESYNIVQCIKINFFI